MQLDQLCPCQIQLRAVQPIKIGKYNTNLGMRLQNISYSGADSFTITTEPHFRNHSVMLQNQEALSLSKQNDINLLLSIFAIGDLVDEELATKLQEYVRRTYPKGSVSKYTKYSIYVPVKDSMLFQKFYSRDMKAGMKINRVVNENSVIN